MEQFRLIASSFKRNETSYKLRDESTISIFGIFWFGFWIKFNHRSWGHSTTKQAWCATNLLSIFRFLCVFWILPFVILAWSRHQSILICNQHSHKTSHSGAKFIMCASFKNRNRITNSTFCGKFHFLVEPNLCAYFYEFNIILVLEC